MHLTISLAVLLPLLTLVHAQAGQTWYVLLPFIHYKVEPWALNIDEYSGKNLATRPPHVSLLRHVVVRNTYPMGNRRKLTDVQLRRIRILWHWRSELLISVFKS